MNHPLLTPVEACQDNEKIIRQLYKEMLSAREGMGGDMDNLLSGPAALKSLRQFIFGIAAAFPTFDLNIEDLMLEGQRVMVRYNISGKQTGNFMGIAPTDEQMAVRVIDIFRLEKGHIVEYWDAARQLSILT
jgi:predicted ester cyclase